MAQTQTLQFQYVSLYFKPSFDEGLIFTVRPHSTLSLCPRTDLSKRFLPKQMTTTG